MACLPPAWRDARGSTRPPSIRPNARRRTGARAGRRWNRFPRSFPRPGPVFRNSSTFSSAVRTACRSRPTRGAPTTPCPCRRGCPCRNARSPQQRLFPRRRLSGIDRLARCGAGRPSRDTAIRVCGDALLPLYRDGDIVVVSPAARIRKGDRVLLRLTDGTLLAHVYEGHARAHPCAPAAGGRRHRQLRRPRGRLGGADHLGKPVSRPSSWRMRLGATALGVAGLAGAIVLLAGGDLPTNGQTDRQSPAQAGDAPPARLRPGTNRTGQCPGRSPPRGASGRAASRHDPQCDPGRHPAAAASARSAEADRGQAAGSAEGRGSRRPDLPPPAGGGCRHPAPQEADHPPRRPERAGPCRDPSVAARRHMALRPAGADRTSCLRQAARRHLRRGDRDFARPDLRAVPAPGHGPQRLDGLARVGLSGRRCSASAAGRGRGRTVRAQGHLAARLARGSGPAGADRRRRSRRSRRRPDAQPAPEAGGAVLEGLLGDVEIVDTPWHPQSAETPDPQDPLFGTGERLPD
ncbi:MAG: hypothetical protein HPM95_04310 [Alphaproteobacteria bacterium]|nr:hypothetical protein [Alphaproteobacteria bacterium]